MDRQLLLLLPLPPATTDFKLQKPLLQFEVALTFVVSVLSYFDVSNPGLALMNFRWQNVTIEGLGAWPLGFRK